MNSKNTNPPTRPKYKRSLKNYLIVPKYQLRYASLMVFVSAVMLGLSYFGTRQLLGAALASCAEVGMDESQLSPILLGFGAFFMVASFFLGIYFSHRTAGPMYRFSKVFENVGAGNYKERVKLRPGDDFQDVADLFNKLMDRIQKDLAQGGGSQPPPVKLEPRKP